MGKQDVPKRHAVGASSDNVGDDAVASATGASREEWFALLDAAGAAGGADAAGGAGATGWRHQAIATWLVNEHGVDPWWAQGVTVAYEQARGIRRPGQRQDGTFEVSVTRTIAADVEPALRALADVVAAETGAQPLALNLAAKHPTARFPLDGGEFVLASATARAEGKTSIGLVRGRMTSGDGLADVKATLRAWLDSVTVESVG